MDIKAPPYRDLYFGMTDSVNEVHKDRDDFVRSYVDLKNIVDDVVAGSRTLIFGPKGTGKSALGHYVSEVGRSRQHVARVVDASTLPLAEIPNLSTGQPKGFDRTVTAWKFILLCNYLELLLTDQPCYLPQQPEVKRVTKLLREFGFMGDASGRAVLKVSKTTVSIPIPKIGTIYKKESQSALNMFSLIPYLEEWALNARSGNRHILFLDGLDSILLNDARYDESLGSLVQAAYSLNQRLSGNGATGSVVLLLRNDVFSRVSGRVPDSQKMRDDFGVELDWRILSGASGEDAPLMRLVNGKATSAAESEVRVLDYFPKSIVVGQGRQIPRMQYLLNLTRHTPRDLLRLFEEIRRVEESEMFGVSGGGVLSREVIREGVVAYSSRYFTGAVKNEFVGFEGGAEAASAGLAALQSLDSQVFDRDQFVSHLESDSVPTHVSVDMLLRMLFFAGAIGNRAGNRDSYMRFFHRRDDADVYLKGQFVLHGALCHAWNIQFAV